MNIIQFNYRQIRSRPLSSVLNIILFATGVTIISLLFLLKDSLESQMDKNAAGIDLVVGAKGSPLQLILSGIYHVDYPTGNIDYDEAIELSKNPLIKQAIPLALGDNYNGFRIVGTNKAYPDIYKGQLQMGSLWQKDFEVTIGSKVASKTGLAIGRQFAGVHGLTAESDHVHKSTPYTVTGIFKETGTVLDQLILSNIESVWRIHESHEHHHDHSEEEEGHNHNTDGEYDHEHDADCDHSHEDHEHEGAEHPKEITSLLIQYQSPMGAITLPRLINKSTNMQAASPVQEINRLYSLLGIGIEALTYISGFIILISALSIFISLLNSLKERKYELALIRVMGGSRFRLFAVVILEGISLAIIGYIAGCIVSRLVMFFLSSYTDNNFNYTLQEWATLTDLSLLIASIIIGAAAAVIPAVKAMKTNISKTLSQ
ncbi:ABC transporter permease [Dysgonomonas sp. UBA7698]|uniref:ABC transporter permease n=1 Tax=Dysgonomonas sp. UBA7698 TaxID=1946427 RepID=UPI0025C113DD|nr:FtsX-like permease family protein [Dysgonomonas sp. UBA7698]